MRSRMLVLALAAIAIVMAAASVWAADEKKFDQEAVLMEFWKAPDDAVVGSVDGVQVTKRELLKTLWFWQAPSMLQDLLNQKMIKKAADDANVDLTWAEVQEKVDENLKRMNMSDMDAFLAQFKVTKQRFLAGTKLNALAEKVVQSQIQIPDSDYAEWIKARHILIKFPQDEQDKDKREAAAKAKIDDIAAKLKAGEDFSKLADEFSEDPGNDVGGEKKGGDLGWFTRGRMVKEFEDAAFALQPGQVSEPVKTFYGYHLIIVDKTGKEASPAEKADLRDQILAKLLPQEMGRWFQELQANSKLDNKLMPPAPERPQPPAMRPGGPPAPRPAPPAPAPRPQAPKPTEKPGAPPAGAKPDAPPPAPPTPPAQ